MSIQYDRYLQALRQNWWIIILATVVAVGLALARASLTPAVYRTNATYIISPTPLENNDDILRGLNTLNQETVALTYVEIMLSTRIFVAAAEQIGDEASEYGSYQVDAIQLPDSNVLRLTVSGPGAATSQALANAIGEETILFGKNLFPIYEIQILDAAPVPDSPSSPTPGRDALLAAVVGFGAGILVALFATDLRELLRSGVIEPSADDEVAESNPA